MTKWSAEQDEFLREHGNEGAERCAALMRHRFGVARTPEAVRRHAYRAGIPIIRYELCQRCGKAVRQLGGDGLCRVCHYRRLADEQRAFNREVVAELRDQAREEEYAQVRKEYQNARQQTSRLCKKNRVKNRKERVYGDSAKCHEEMSQARSGA